MPCGAAVAEPIHNENWSRHDVASHLDRFVGGNAISERQYTKLKGLSRTTFQHWRHRRDNAVSQIDEADFLESAVGTKFVHRLYVALHLVLNQDGATGLRRIAKIIELTGIDTLAANSYGSQQKYAQSVEAAILDYESHERPLLVKGMSQKAITTCNDESFFGGKPCLVSIEPVSNFILLEEFTDKRDADTWEEKFDAATKDLPIKVIQSTSDEGGGILSHAKRQGAHHSPDLFHIEQELCRGVTAPLACLVQRSKKAEEEALEDLKNSPNQNDSKLKNEINKAAAKRSQYETLATSAKDIIHDISAAYHPINLKNGHHVMPSYLDHELGQKFDELTRLAKNARLSEKSFKHIKKARKLLPQMIKTIRFFQLTAATSLSNFGLSDFARTMVYVYLIPLFYLKEVSRKDSNAMSENLAPIIDRLETEIRREDSPLTLIDAESKENITNAGKACAAIFQRSSSCVEGRNGHLSLHQNGLHTLSPQKLKTFTILHNYFHTRDDKTTAAERFFGARPTDIFEWLLAHTNPPSRPRKNPTLQIVK